MRCFDCLSHAYEPRGDQKAICVNLKVVLHSGQIEPGHPYIHRSGNCSPLLPDCHKQRIATTTTTTPSGRRG